MDAGRRDIWEYGNFISEEFDRIDFIVSIEII